MGTGRFPDDHDGGNEMAWLGGDGGSAFKVGTLPLPIDSCNFAFTIMVAIPPVNPHPLTWIGTSKDENAGKDENGWLKEVLQKYITTTTLKTSRSVNWQDGSVFCRWLDRNYLDRSSR